MLSPEEVRQVIERKAALAATPIALTSTTDDLYQQAAMIELKRKLDSAELEQVKSTGVHLRL